MNFFLTKMSYFIETCTKFPVLIECICEYLDIIEITKLYKCNKYLKSKIHNKLINQKRLVAFKFMGAFIENRYLRAEMIRDDEILAVFGDYEFGKKYITETLEQGGKTEELVLRRYTLRFFKRMGLLELFMDVYREYMGETHTKNLLI